MRRYIFATLVTALALVASANGQCIDASQTIFFPATSGRSCPAFGAVTEDTHFYRIYDGPADGGFFSAVDVCAVEFPVWYTKSGDGTSGNCAVIRLWADSNFDDYPGDAGNPQPLGVCGGAPPAGVSLLAEDQVYIPDSASGTTFRHEMECPPVWDPGTAQLIVEVYFKCPADTSGRIEIGTSDLGWTAPSFMQAATCAMPVPVVNTSSEDVIIDVEVHLGGSGCSTCVGPQMEHPGSNEDLMLVSANRGFLGLGPSSDMSDGHGGATEKPGTGNDVIELRFRIALRHVRLRFVRPPRDASRPQRQRLGLHDLRSDGGELLQRGGSSTSTSRSFFPSAHRS